MDPRIDIENARADAVLVERAIAQFVEHRAGVALFSSATARGRWRSARPAMFSAALIFLPNPFSPLALRRVGQFARAGRRGRRHSPSATIARRNGQGLLGETANRSGGVVPERYRCGRRMAQIPKRQRMMKNESASGAKRNGSKGNSAALLLQAAGGVLAEFDAVSTDAKRLQRRHSQESAASFGADSTSVNLPKGMPAFRRPSR